MNAPNTWNLIPTVLLAALIVAGGCERAADRAGASAEQSSADGANQADEHPGRAVYRRYCIMCHGENLEGTQLGPSLVDGVWSEGRNATEADVAAVVREGVPEPEEFGVPMPPANGAGMTEDQVASVAAYVASLAR